MNDEPSRGVIARTVDAGVLTIEIAPLTDSTGVRLEGELDVSTVHAVETELRRAIDGSADSVTVDLNGLEFIDAAGIACLLKSTQGPRRRPVVRFLRPPAAIARVLVMASVSDLLPYVD